MRLGPPDPATMTAEQRRVQDIITRGPRGQVRGPLAIWLHRPELAQAAQALGAYCRYGSSLEPRLSELAILTMAVVWQSDFEWWAHKPIALKAGLSESVTDALAAGRPPAFADAEEEIVHTVITTLSTKRRLPDALYATALDLLGRDRLVDLIGLCGYYTLISMTLNAFEVPLPEGESPELSGTSAR
ncbi:carboxymuconolactone decarboxylase family protein [Xinfangfangia pollutisoli]|uniref:carboxymuconolactone decarboxylase family protein n=1 Tax=Xinfangfangia pollutisoli TaxID=2865960 RepID=UPI001CD5BCCE|nr:carboxymuconolactone decarboxylase family protein [Xinfangfangia pollutisoli]